MREERVQVSGHSAAEPAAVWAVAGDFCGLWHPVMAEIRAERAARGALIRAFTAKGEATIYRERLVYRSDSDRVLVYTHLEGIVGCESYAARLSVSPGENGGSRIEWSARLTAEDDRVGAIAAGTKAIFEMGIGALAGIGGCSSQVSGSTAISGAIPPSVLPDISPSRGEIRQRREPHPSSTSSTEQRTLVEAERPPHLISPLEGEMPGRAEGGTAKLESISIDGNPRLALTTTPPSSGLLTLFLHGIGGGRSNWLPQLSAAAPFGLAASLDLRGYGDSQLGPSQSTVDDYCADILRVMETLGVTRLILCGLSYGSWIATSFAMRHPEKLTGLVLSGGCTGMSEAGIEEREAFRQSREVPLDLGKTPADFAPAVVNVLAGPDAGEDVRRKLFDSMAAIPAATYRDALNCFTNPAERFDFAKLTMPVLMMTGAFDRLAPPAEIRGVANRIVEAAPDASVRFEIIAGAGHVCNVECPDAYNTVLTEFLSEVTA
ncbi:alpha/beta fold hydrolase [Rhizobium sp.]